MASAVRCSRGSAYWERNSNFEDACLQYAHLVGNCDTTFVMLPVTPSSPPYSPTAAGAPCACNLVGYSLMAGYCAAAGQEYNPTSTIDSMPGAASLVIPEWARHSLPPTGAHPSNGDSGSSVSLPAGATAVLIGIFALALCVMGSYYIVLLAVLHFQRRETAAVAEKLRAKTYGKEELGIGEAPIQDNSATNPRV
ncbi:hypothetical protein M408DRAFT_27539 [Serendipita vermifera MAFF 305830]|uniref:Uncharacterized protein n=1 Tax=Serendipita vermifera MAFF 305830 TaxID=933852 RepID=A0A0C3AUX5_SERVB|nr:hypothetical protein M408DRAFT_27539 [Serendipita vermifera MAFF 305830]